MTIVNNYFHTPQKMDQNHPEWLTLDFLNHCIRSKERYQGMSTTIFTAESAVAPGNNYGSYILRVRMKVQDQTNGREDSLSLIIKCPLNTGIIKEFFQSIYESESVFYNEILPLGQQLVNRSFTAEHFRSPISKVVVLEDLTEIGFVMAEKVKQLDFEHCQCYVTAAASFHAMSFAVHKHDPDLIYRISKEKMFSNDLDQEMIETNKNMIKYCVECFVKHVSAFLEDDRIPTIIQKSSALIWDLLVRGMMPSETFNTLNQGDPWLTNMMFKRDGNGKAYDIKLIDFQCLRYASPIIDLVFFIWTSANYDVLQNKLDALYELYLERLNSTLEEMKFEEKLTMKSVKEQVAQLSPLVIWIVLLGRPMLMKSSYTDMDSIYSQCKEEYSPDCNPYEALYTESFCKNHLPRLVELLDTSGVFHYMQSKLQN